MLVGPTAVGKSATAVALAGYLNGEVVSADSMQVYRGLDIGTDKVSPERRAEVPHHLIDICDPDERMDAARWTDLAEAAIAAARDRGRMPIIAGGTGLYVRCLLKGMFEGPGRNPELRRRLLDLCRRKGRSWLSGMLGRLDPEAAQRVEPRDARKAVRYLEIILAEGRPVSVLQAQWERADRYRAAAFGLRRSRAELVARIDSRVESMYHHGLVDEVRALLERGVRSDAHAFKAIGYREALGVVQGRWSLREAISRTQAASRQYAKRQMTWFRREEGLVWIEADDDPDATARRILEFLAPHADPENRDAE